MGGILGVSADPIDQALAELSAESRALLELSVRRGIPDDEIASLLGTSEAGVRLRRESVMHALADSLGEEPDSELHERVSDHLGGRGNLFAPSEREPQPEAQRRGRLVPAAIGGVLTGAVVAAIFALQGGDDDQRSRRTFQLGPEARLEPLTGRTRARGTARLVQRDGRDRLELRIEGLPRPRGGYAVWLFSRVNRARQLGSFSSGDIELDAPLPPGADRYRDLDVSVEPDDGNDNHSGESILRVPLARLRP